VKRIYPGFMFYTGPNLFGGKIPKSRAVRPGTTYIVPVNPPLGKPKPSR
jgi:hypothetical protein